MFISSSGQCFSGPLRTESHAHPVTTDTFCGSYTVQLDCTFIHQIFVLISDKQICGHGPEFYDQRKSANRQYIMFCIKNLS